MFTSRMTQRNPASHPVAVPPIYRQQPSSPANAQALQCPRQTNTSCQGRPMTEWVQAMVMDQARMQPVACEYSSEESLVSQGPSPHAPRTLPRVGRRWPYVFSDGCAHHAVCDLSLRQAGVCRHLLIHAVGSPMPGPPHGGQEDGKRHANSEPWRLARNPIPDLG